MYVLEFQYKDEALWHPCCQRDTFEEVLAWSEEGGWAETIFALRICKLTENGAYDGIRWLQILEIQKTHNWMKEGF